ncbi:MAG: 4Fe-4S binding protein [Desulfurococcaceae archaeon]
MEFKKLGYLTHKDLEDLNIIPPSERLKKGPVVIVECPEEIPCDVCIYACPYGAISKESIYSVPRVDWDKCNGCGVCVPQCPGLAMFVIDLSKSGASYVTLPYEFLPEPVKGDVVVLLGRDGRELGLGKVVKAWRYLNTWSITVEVPREVAMDVRAIWIQRK